MKIIDLDGSAWSSEADFYSTLLSALGSPRWHGHNLDALWDSLTSDINEIGPPLSVIVRNTDRSATDMTALFKDVSKVFADVRSQRGLDARFIVS
tara:strand:+ start:502 stop:786 length:285 start_codon:yes stop_codon:yes gene_type:complete